MVIQCKSFVIIILALIGSSTIHAQYDCSFPWDVDLESQQEIDDFLSSGNDCVKYELRIEGNDITNLNGLINLTHVDGKLLIGNCPNLQNLSGLDNLVHVDELISLFNNSSLTSVEGLGSLMSGGVNFYVSQCPITTFAPMTSMQNIGKLRIEQTAISSLEGIHKWGSGDKLIKDCPNLTTLQGLEASTGYTGNLQLVNLPNLANLSGLEVFHGFSGLEINNTAITNLGGLENLEYINFDGFQILNNDNLISFEGLEQFESTLNEFVIANNDALTTFEGFPPFTCRDIEIIDNDNITSLKGLDTLTFSGIKIEGNASLENLKEFNNEDTITILQIIDNPKLIDLSGLEDIRIVGNVNITGNQNLVSLTGLEGIEKIDGTLSILNTPVLKNLTGLNNLTEIDNFFNVRENVSLSDFTGLENLISIKEINFRDNFALRSIKEMIRLDTVGRITIKDNANLSQCHAYGICASMKPNTSINNNKTGCDDKYEVSQSCSLLPRVQARTFYDYNQNKIQDADETGVTLTLTMYPDNVDYIINSGQDIFTQANNVIEYDATKNPNWTLTTDSVSYILDAVEGSNKFAPFGVYPSEDLSKIEMFITSPPTRCNEQIPFIITATNLGTTITNGIMWFGIDENVDSISFVQEPDTTIASFNIYGWFFEDFYPAQTFSQLVYIDIPGPPDFTLGENLIFRSFSNYIDINGEHTSGGYRYNPVVLCSYDPNDKLVHPNRDFGEVLFDETFTYTIRFQNTGNAVAYDVFIKDTLDANLDRETFRVLGSSHFDVLTTSMDTEGILTFDFSNIFLPDSTANLEGSQGYVAYRIDPIEGLDVNTTISNRAGIYFDQNPPIITNTVESVLVDMLTAVTPVTLPGVSIFPNPNTGIFELRGVQLGNYKILNINGQTIESGSVNGNTLLDISTAPQGVYFVYIEVKGQLAVERIVKLND